MLKVRGETFRLDVLCLIFSRCSWETIFVPIFVIFFSMFCLENAFFRLSTCKGTVSHTCLSEYLPVCLSTCQWLLPSSNWNVLVSQLWTSPCSPGHEATRHPLLAPPPARRPRQMIGRCSGTRPPGNGCRRLPLVRTHHPLLRSHPEGTEEGPWRKHWRGSHSPPEDSTGQHEEPHFLRRSTCTRASPPQLKLWQTSHNLTSGLSYDTDIIMSVLISPPWQKWRVCPHTIVHIVSDKSWQITTPTEEC